MVIDLYLAPVKTFKTACVPTIWEVGVSINEDTVADRIHTLKELADLVFVCYQYAVARNWNLDTAMKRVFESNMSKFVDGKPLRREDGKILKGPDYKPPFLDDLV